MNKSKSKSKSIAFLLFILIFFILSCNQKEIIFEIPVLADDEFIDIRDDQIYKFIELGDQIWMAQNLSSTMYTDGTPINNVTDNASWLEQTSGAYCWYDNLETHKYPYGALYNGYAISQNVCPVGWHIPSDDEWTQLEIYLIAEGYNYDGSTNHNGTREYNNKIAKSMAVKAGYWNSDYTTDTEGAPGNYDYIDYMNKSGFSVYPAGFRGNYKGEFYGETVWARFWSNTLNESNIFYYYRFLWFWEPSLNRNHFTKVDGASVRCIKNQ